MKQLGHQMGYPKRRLLSEPVNIAAFRQVFGTTQPKEMRRKKLITGIIIAILVLLLILGVSPVKIW